MKIFGLHWLGHLAWVTVIFAAIFWAEKRLAATEMPFKNRLPQLLYTAADYLPDSWRGPMGNIRRTRHTWPSEVNFRLDSLAQIVEKETAAFVEPIEKISSRAWNGELPDAEKTGQILLADFQKLTDRLAGFCEKNINALAKLQQAGVSINSSEKIVDWIDLIEKKHPSAQTALINNLKFRAGLAQNIALKSLEKRLTRDWVLFTAQKMPLLVLKQKPVVGQPVELEISWPDYSAASRNLTCKINGKSTPIERGVAHFEMVCREAGLKKLAVELTITNPLTHDSHVYFKEFELEIQP